MSNTVIYYTSNRERPEFEKKIQEDLLSKIGDLPLISVSQKPIDLGKNICVGDVGTSGFNVCRQIQIACEEAKTDFVVTAEADCLYSPDYFYFDPPKLDACYRNTNIYVLRYRAEFFSKKDMSLFSQVVGREFFLRRLEDLFEGAPQWSIEEKNFPKERRRNLFDEFEYFETKYPCISFKTGKGMRQHTSTDAEEIYELPYWGDAKSFRGKYL
jgi:hypothetical protein